MIFSGARARMARRLVMLVSDRVDSAYRANCDGRRRAERAHRMVASWMMPVLLPIALWLDREAAGQQMFEECWWG